MQTVGRWAVCALACAAAACSGSRGFDTLRPGATERGIASWYGPGFHGKHTANGEVYDMDGISAAHKTLPFDTVVRVRNLDNGRDLEVRVNDRGPFVRGRIIDLSREAARQIGMIGPGTARVEIEILSVPGAPLRGERFAVQLGAYRDELEAMAALDAVRARVPDARLYEGDGWHRVLAGRFEKERKADKLARKLRHRGLDAFVRRVPKGV